MNPLEAEKRGCVDAAAASFAIFRNRGQESAVFLAKCGEMDSGEGS